MHDEGATCQICGTTAVACQHAFQASIDTATDRREWCCAGCAELGARWAHAGIGGTE